MSVGQEVKRPGSCHTETQCYLYRSHLDLKKLYTLAILLLPCTTQCVNCVEAIVLTLFPQILASYVDRGAVLIQYDLKVYFRLII